MEVGGRDGIEFVAAPEAVLEPELAVEGEAAFEVEAGDTCQLREPRVCSATWFLRLFGDNVFGYIPSDAEKEVGEEGGRSMFCGVYVYELERVRKGSIERDVCCE